MSRRTVELLSENKQCLKSYIPERSSLEAVIRKSIEVNAEVRR